MNHLAFLSTDYALLKVIRIHKVFIKPNLCVCVCVRVCLCVYVWHHIGVCTISANGIITVRRFSNKSESFVHVVVYQYTYMYVYV